MERKRGRANFAHSADFLRRLATLPVLLFLQAPVAAAQLAPSPVSGGALPVDSEEAAFDGLAVGSLPGHWLREGHPDSGVVPDPWQPGNQVLRVASGPCLPSWVLGEVPQAGTQQLWVSARVRVVAGGPSLCGGNGTTGLTLHRGGGVPAKPAAAFLPDGALAGTAGLRGAYVPDAWNDLRLVYQASQGRASMRLWVNGHDLGWASVPEGELPEPGHLGFVASRGDTLYVDDVEASTWPDWMPLAGPEDPSGILATASAAQGPAEAPPPAQPESPPPSAPSPFEEGSGTSLAAPPLSVGRNIPEQGQVHAVPGTLEFSASCLGPDGRALRWYSFQQQGDRLWMATDNFSRPGPRPDSWFHVVFTEPGTYLVRFVCEYGVLWDAIEWVVQVHGPPPQPLGERLQESAAEHTWELVLALSSGGALVLFAVDLLLRRRERKRP